MGSTRKYQVTDRLGTHDSVLCYEHVWLRRLAGDRCLPISRALLGTRCYQCWVDNGGDYCQRTTKRQQQSIRLYRVTDRLGTYDTEMCYKHVWTKRLAGDRCLPISRALHVARCFQCWVNSEDDYYFRLYHSHATMHGA